MTFLHDKHIFPIVSIVPNVSHLYIVSFSHNSIERLYQSYSGAKRWIIESIKTHRIVKMKYFYCILTESTIIHLYIHFDSELKYIEK